MKSFHPIRILCLILTLILAPGCVKVFENDHDLQAQKALKDLMAIQDQFYQKNQRYAKNLVEIEDYKLEYHSGIVYLEIESAGKDKYRAIALPAESTTARVFAYDTAQGGFYEMGEEEVASYVLGALNYIRGEQRKKRVIDIVSGLLMVILIAMGFKLHALYKGPKSAWAMTPYFLAIPPLIMAVAALNHMNRDIMMTPFLQTLIFGSIGLSGLAVVMGMMSFTKLPPGDNRPALIGVVMCTLMIAVFNIAILANTYVKYAKAPGRGDTYFIPAPPRPR
ncbi:hypothetical protein ACTRW9_07780 [Nitrospina sp. 32_T5]|uniref:hypothetical protein n=1 Tax=unclassified Nitrospina TaxID=2638683 RepID=UPI003F96C055